MVEILPSRELIHDVYGNWYAVLSSTDKNLVLVNAVAYYASNRIINQDYCKDHENETILHFPTEILKHRIQQLSDGKVPGKIFTLESLLDRYEIVVEGLYDPDPRTK